MKKDDICQTNKVQAQLSSGKPAFEPVAVFSRQQRAGGERAGATITGPAPW